MNGGARRWRIGGLVQGVGYRPFVHRLAHVCRLTGWVRNDCGGVEIHAEGAADNLTVFGRGLLERPPPARARLLEERTAAPEFGADFVIRPSVRGRVQSATIPLDLAPCDACLKELHQPAARRHRHPFINCTQCGPRYSIIHALPYDRANTTLERFALCADCAAEHADPGDRRFHAQPLACTACGPALYWHAEQAPAARQAAALAAAVAALRRGLIVALRGVGGYQLLCDASVEAAVVRLRERKARPAKPLAVMVPWCGVDGLDAVRDVAQVSRLMAAALLDPARPIVIAGQRPESRLCAAVAPGLRDVGVMLPCSPLHHLLLQDFRGPLVATSGNVSGEPLCVDPEEAERVLMQVADGFLHHDRAIAQPVDDAVVRVWAGAARPLRLGRGTAPLELSLEQPVGGPLLAVGAFSKNCVALATGRRVLLSPHIGAQTTPRGAARFARVVGELQRLSGISAARIVHDAHPGYPSTRWAQASGLPTTAVWHHHAHASAVAGEYPDAAPLLCFTWDGVGLGPDDTLWGGEALAGRPGAWRRVASMRPFRLPGGERAAREPWRAALALCWEAGTAWPEGEERGGEVLRHAFTGRVNTPVTTSVGRLFDAAAALLGVCVTSSYEAEAAMRLEALCEGRAAPWELPLARDETGLWRSDWAPLLPALLDRTCTVAGRAARFHATMAHVLLAQARAIREDTGIERVGLTGGVFQNRVLTSQARELLCDAEFTVLIPERLPLNDAALSVGQIIEAGALHAVG